MSTLGHRKGTGLGLPVRWGEARLQRVGLSGVSSPKLPNDRGSVPNSPGTMQGD